MFSGEPAKRPAAVLIVAGSSFMAPSGQSPRVDAFGRRIAAGASPSTPAPALSKPQLREAIRKAQIAVLTTQHPQDVVIVFPRGKKLYYSSLVLKAASPYFARVLNQQEQHDEHRPAKRSRISSTPIKHGLYESAADEDDSDAEYEELDILDASIKVECDASMDVFEVTGHSYRTYKAVLDYLTTGKINFTFTTVPIKTTFTCVSAKSVYRLAAYLEIQVLKEHALDAYRSRLTDRNVYRGLFSRFAHQHSEIRDAAMDLAAKHWARIADLDETIEEERRLVRDGAPWAAAVSFMLARKVRQYASGRGASVAAPGNVDRKQAGSPHSCW